MEKISGGKRFNLLNPNALIWEQTTVNIKAEVTTVASKVLCPWTNLSISETGC
jgi:hypothetical protein